MYEQSHRDYLRFIFASSSAWVWPLNYRDNAYYLQSPARQKCRRTEAWRTRQLLTCRCVSVMRCARCNIVAGVSDAKAENDALRMMLPLVVVGCNFR